MECQKNNCQKQAINTVHFELRVHNMHAPAVSGPVLHLCDEHSLDYDFNDFMIGDNWERICNGFEAAGRQRPVKEFCNIVVKPIK